MFFDAINRLVAVGFPEDTAITLSLTLLKEGHLLEYVEQQERDFKNRCEHETEVSD